MPSLSHAARRGAACAAILIAALLTTSACGPDSPPNGSGDLSSYDYTEEPAEEPTEEPTELIEPVEASVPDSVVGVWCGGSNAEVHRAYEFSGTGEFMVSRGSTGSSGVVVSDSQYMTFHVPGEPPFVSSWEVVQDPVLGPLLFLDGYSYLPGSCNS